MNASLAAVFDGPKMKTGITLAEVIDLRQYGVDAAARRVKTGQACAPWQRGYPHRDMSQLDGCPTPNGRAPGCRDSLTSANNAAVGAGATATLTFTVGVRMRVDAILVVTTGAAGFTLSNFVINNVNQWTLGQTYHSAIFAPGGDANTAFAGDYIDQGSQVSMVVVNLDGGAAQGIFVTLKGPGA